jgi:acetyl-CoA C-acetyltransferase
MESMTNAPYALLKHRSGARIGHDRIIDTMMWTEAVTVIVR